LRSLRPALSGPSAGQPGTSATWLWSQVLSGSRRSGRLGPPLVLSLGTLAAGFTFPLLLHLVLAYPSGRLRSTSARGLVIVVYLEAALTALGRVLFRDPFFDPNCWDKLHGQCLPRQLPPAGRPGDSAR
jgi:hypothetical protein